MKSITEWRIYYGDRYLFSVADTKWSKSFSAEKAALEANPRYDEESIKRRMDNLRECKMGITSNLKNRKNNLGYTEGTYIHKTIVFYGTYAQALKVESDVRWMIEQTCGKNVKHQGNDHFKCSNINTMRSIYNHFDEWAEQAIIWARAEKQS